MIGVTPAARDVTGSLAEEPGLQYPSAMPQTCFVIMGFGKKTDYSDGLVRTLDLDAT